MHRQVTTIRFLFILALVLCGGLLLSIPKKTDGYPSVSMLDVGQGDSFLIQSSNGKQILIDGGKDASVLSELAKTMPKGDRSIDVVIATHPDADHIGGLPLVLSRYKVGLFLTSHVQSGTEIERELYHTIESQAIPAYYVRKGMKVTMPEPNFPIDFLLLFPDRDTLGWETNTASVVGRLQIGKRSILFTGDSPQSVESYLASVVPNAIRVDILKLGHHGSKTSSGEAFLRAVSPSLALISAGAHNRYGHPAPEVTDRLHMLGIPTVSTVDADTYTLSTDGVKWYTK